MFFYFWIYFRALYKRQELPVYMQVSMDGRVFKLRAVSTVSIKPCVVVLLCVIAAKIFMFVVNRIESCWKGNKNYYWVKRVNCPRHESFYSQISFHPLIIHVHLHHWVSFPSHSPVCCHDFHSSVIQSIHFCRACLVGHLIFLDSNCHPWNLSGIIHFILLQQLKIKWKG